MVGTAQPLCLSASETEGRRYDMTMNLGKSEITAPHYNAGLDDKIPSSRRGSVFLDIPFYRTGFSVTGIRRYCQFPKSRLVGTDLAHFPEARFWPTSGLPTIHETWGSTPPPKPVTIGLA
jgi:hypothetical protein